MVEGQPRCGGGEVNMQVAFEVSAKSMYYQIDSRNKSLFFRLCFNDAGSDRSDFIDERSIVPENVPEYIGHGESDVLPARAGQSIVGILHPNVSSLFATGGTKSTFACEKTEPLERATNTAKESIA